MLHILSIISKFYPSLFTWRKKTTVVVEPAVDQTVEDPPVEPAVDQTVEDPPVEPDEVTSTEENGTTKLSTIKTC